MGKSVGNIGSVANKTNDFNAMMDLIGGEGGTRTPDPAIMSRVL